MPTSPHADAYTWHEETDPPDDALLAEEPTPASDQQEGSINAVGYDSADEWAIDEVDEVPAGHVRVVRSVVEIDEPYEAAETATGTEYAAAPGLPGRGVIMISAGSSLGCAALDVALTGGLTMFFDLCFVVICLVGAMAVRPRDLFTTGVLAPLAFGGTILVVACLSPDALVANVGIGQAFLTGLADHAGALVAGYAVALGTVAGRVSARRQRASV